jgi:hypothetical protein
MKASSESGLWAMEMSSNAGVATPDVFVLTVRNGPFEETEQQLFDAAMG